MFLFFLFRNFNVLDLLCTYMYYVKSNSNQIKKPLLISQNLTSQGETSLY